MRGAKKGVPHKTYGKQFDGSWSYVIQVIKSTMHLSNKELAYILGCHKSCISKWYCEKWCPVEKYGKKLLLLASRAYKKL